MPARWSARSNKPKGPRADPSDVPFAPVLAPGGPWPGHAAGRHAPQGRPTTSFAWLSPSARGHYTRGLCPCAQLGPRQGPERPS
eukprot:4811806-Alexandrium_andersonii.AAC.1